ncbi:MAG: hypothetical protein HGA65_13085, partial [Oscillochloris sp.]|nr:hypothetical protein [Oscillochloris sp.]
RAHGQLRPLNQLVLIGTELAALQPTLCAQLDACAESIERAEAWRARSQL